MSEQQAARLANVNVFTVSRPEERQWVEKEELKNTGAKRKEPKSQREEPTKSYSYPKQTQTKPNDFDLFIHFTVYRIRTLLWMETHHRRAGRGSLSRGWCGGRTAGCGSRAPGSDNTVPPPPPPLGGKRLTVLLTVRWNSHLVLSNTGGSPSVLPLVDLPPQ